MQIVFNQTRTLTILINDFKETFYIILHSHFFLNTKQQQHEQKEYQQQ